MSVNKYEKLSKNFRKNKNKSTRISVLSWKMN